jgi:hypothetical protein
MRGVIAPEPWRRRWGAPVGKTEGFCGLAVGRRRVGGGEGGRKLGRQAARTVLAPLQWRAVAGDVFDTTQVCGLLGISRQAVAKRVRHRSLLAIPGRGTTYFPTWQFDLDRGIARPVVKDLLRIFHESLGTVDPLVIASWSKSPQHNELKGLSPQEWIQKDWSDKPLALAAERAAAALAA